MEIELSLIIDPCRIPGVISLLTRGFRMGITNGETVTHFLTHHIGIPSDYLANRVQTVFLNHRPLDNIAEEILTNGDTLSLSTAMPGLAGATLRKGGVLAGMRDGISHASDTTVAEKDRGTITVRLFNFIARETGHLFLKNGILMTGDNCRKLMKSVLANDLKKLTIDGKAVLVEDLHNWPLDKHTVLLKMTKAS